MTNIGGQIKKLRTQKAITIKELGEEIGFNYNILSKIEKNEQKPTIELLEKLSDFFDVDSSYFFGEKQDIPDDLKNLGVEWIAFSEEIKEKNVSIEELTAFAEKILKFR